jgi:hypothetical protein
MSTGTHVLVVIVAVLIVLVVLRMVALHQLRSKYALVWLVVALALMVVSVFPGLLDELADLVGVSYAPTLFLLIALGFLGLLVAHLTWEVSRLEMRLRTLAEDHALLRELIDEQGLTDRRPTPPAEPRVTNAT